MGPVDPRRLVWALNRGYLRHGVAYVLTVVGTIAVLVLVVGAAFDAWQLQRTQRALAERLHDLRVSSRPVAEQASDAALPLPALSRRFDINRRILDALAAAALAPEQIRFRYENVGDAGLVRQTAVFTLKASWSEIAKALAALQAADRSLYIAKLRLEREQPGDPMVTAELQVAVALTLDPDDGSSAP